MRLPTEAAARSPSPSRQSRTDESTPSRRSRADFCFRKAAALREYDRAGLALDAPIRSLREIHGGPVRRAQMSTISGNRRKEEKGQRGERNSLATGSGHSPRTSKTATSHVSDQLESLRWKAPARQPGKPAWVNRSAMSNATMDSFVPLCIRSNEAAKALYPTVS